MRHFVRETHDSSRLKGMRKSQAADANDEVVDENRRHGGRVGCAYRCISCHLRL